MLRDASLTALVRRASRLPGAPRRREGLEQQGQLGDVAVAERGIGEQCGIPAAGEDRAQTGEKNGDVRGRSRRGRELGDELLR